MSFWGIIYFSLSRGSTLIGTAPSAGYSPLDIVYALQTKLRSLSASWNDVIKIIDKL